MSDEKPLVRSRLRRSTVENADAADNAEETANDDAEADDRADIKKLCTKLLSVPSEELVTEAEQHLASMPESEDKRNLEYALGEAIGMLRPSQCDPVIEMGPPVGSLLRKPAETPKPEPEAAPAPPEEPARPAAPAEAAPAPEPEQTPEPPKASEPEEPPVSGHEKTVIAPDSHPLQTTEKPAASPSPAQPATISALYQRAVEIYRDVQKNRTVGHAEAAIESLNLLASCEPKETDRSEIRKLVGYLTTWIEKTRKAETEKSAKAAESAEEVSPPAEEPPPPAQAASPPEEEFSLERARPFMPSVFPKDEEREKPAKRGPDGEDHSRSDPAADGLASTFGKVEEGEHKSVAPPPVTRWTSMPEARACIAMLAVAVVAVIVAAVRNPDFPIPSSGSASPSAQVE